MSTESIPMKPETKIIIATIILVVLSFFIPLPVWSILWLDIVIITTVVIYDYRGPLIIAIIMMLGILVLWLLHMNLAANRLTHFAFLWSLFGILKFMSVDLLNRLKKKIFDIKGDILKDLYHEDDSVVNLFKETVIIAIISGTYVVADLFINSSWWF